MVPTHHESESHASLTEGKEMGDYDAPQLNPRPSVASQRSEKRGRTPCLNQYPGHTGPGSLEQASSLRPCVDLRVWAFVFCG